MKENSKNSKYSILIKKRVEKELRRIPKSSLKRIYNAIESLKNEPRPRGVIKIKGNEGYRIQVGNYRILYTIDDKDKVVKIFRVKKRGSVYSNL
ncbi:MAG: type II toxin-antitoxin system RelE/ParE family toxin [Methanosarcinales archaeon]